MSEHDIPKTRAVTDETFSILVSTDDCSLKVLDGPHQGVELSLDRELIRIGRAEWCDIALPDDQWVSNVHCECWLDNQGVRLRDLNSRNGVVLEGCKIFDAYLSEGVVFQIGRSNIQLVSHQRQRELAIKYRDESGLLVGRSPAMRKVFSMLSRLAEVNVNTLLTGETGTGKTSIAEAIHRQSPQSDRPFVVVNCGALPANLIEAQLFGYEKGAFTGAEKQHKGFFEQAHKGTLFLDEIAELPLDLQPKLLDVLERRKIRRIGGKEEIHVDFRLITATHRNLPEAVKNRSFREDLYFRLSVVVMDVPPLRERIEDIPLLVNKLVKEIAPERPIRLTEPAIQALQRQLWPGNIRQLRNTLEHAITFLHGEMLSVQDIQTAFEASKASDWLHASEFSQEVPATTSQENPQPLPVVTTAPSVKVPSASPTLPGSGDSTDEYIADSPVSLTALLPRFPLAAQTSPLSLKETLETIEKALVAQALEETDQNAQEAAALLGISLGWLYNRTRKYELELKTKKKKS